MRPTSPTAAPATSPAPIAVPHSEPAEGAGRSRALELLTAQSFSLIAMVAANEAANVDRVGRFVLDGLTRRARRFLAKIEAELERGVSDGAYGTAGRFGENGHAPTIRALIRESGRQRELAGQPETAVNSSARRAA